MWTRPFPARNRPALCGGERAGRKRPPPEGPRGLSSRGGAPCSTTTASTTSPAFTPSSKRRKGFPSETRVQRGARVVHGDKELLEKLGRNDPCPCGSGRRFQALLSR
ncbi:MAG TPA: SEC-C metal-binding domain-containing protein, partial [Thermoanaerobaculia bacterium]